MSLFIVLAKMNRLQKPDPVKNIQFCAPQPFPVLVTLVGTWKNVYRFLLFFFSFLFFFCKINEKKFNLVSFFMTFGIITVLYSTKDILSSPYL